MRKYKSYFFAFSIALLSITTLLLLKNAYLFGDELIHYQTIKDFTNLKISDDTFLRDAKFPGYAALIGVLRRILNIDSIFGTRVINFIISSFCIYVFYLISKKRDAINARIKTLQFFFFPLVFIFFFLLYTDILSLFLLLLSFYFIQNKNYSLSGIPAILSILVRQNNIIWVLFLLFLVIRENRGTLMKYFKSSWIYILGIFSFLAFVFINKGTTIGEVNKTYQPVSIHSENFFFFLFLSFFLFFPSIVLSFKTILKFLKNKAVFTFIVILFIIYFVSFKADHPWNSIMFSYYVRNDILHFILRNDLIKITFFIPMAVSIIYFLSIKLHDNYKLLFFSFGIIFLTMSWLVDPRYYIIPFTFLLLLKNGESKKIEFLTIILYMLLSFGIFFATLNRSFFI